MNAKITINKLSELLAAKSHMDATRCEEFLRELFALISEQLEAGESVKVKGLGTFKPILVDDRRSINVNTGEEMLIPAHRKVSFTPDKGLAEAVNAPFSMFEPVELSDSVSEDMLNEEAEDAVTESDADRAEIGECVAAELLHDESENLVTSVVTNESMIEEGSDEEAMAEEETSEAYKALQAEMDHEVEEEEQSESLSETASLPQLEETRSSQNIEKDNEVAPAEEKGADVGDHKVSITVEAPYIKPTRAMMDDSVAGESEHPKRSHRFAKGLLIGIAGTVVALVGLGALWRFLSPETFCRVTGTTLATAYSEEEVVGAMVVADSPKSYAQARKQGEQVMNAEDREPEELPEKLLNEDSRKVEAQASTTKAEEVATAPSDVKEAQNQPKKEESAAASGKKYDTVSRTRYLTTMAREYYGDYNLWPFIYDENSAILGHPDRIKPGTKVVIPPASKYGIDANNKECVAKAKRRGQEIYAKYR